MNTTDRTSTTDQRSPAFAGPCPRCGGGVPNDQHPGEYPGALSRYDNETYVCSSCGSAEAMMGGHLIPFEVGLYSEEAETIRQGFRSGGVL